MTTEESFAALEAVRTEQNPYEFTQEEWRTLNDEQKEDRYALQCQWKKEHEARWLEAVHNIVPKEGLPCTIIYYSDKRAATVTRIISEREVEVTYNKVMCNDYYAGDYKILQELEDGLTYVFTKRRNGMWVMKGQNVTHGVKLILHYQRHYIDPHY